MLRVRKLTPRQPLRVQHPTADRYTDDMNNAAEAGCRASADPPEAFRGIKNGGFAAALAS
jgi:hypothetical protein